MAQKYLVDLIQLSVRQEKSTLSNLVIRSYLLTGKEDKTQIYFGNNLQRDTWRKKEVTAVSSLCCWFSPGTSEVL